MGENMLLEEGDPDLLPSEFESGAVRLVERRAVRELPLRPPLQQQTSSIHSARKQRPTTCLEHETAVHVLVCTMEAERVVATDGA